MKQSLVKASLCLFALSFFSLQASAAASGCAGKKQEIEQQIKYAQQHGNTHRIAGLEKALSEIDENCTESGLLRERQDKVAEKKQKVMEREQELKEARADGREEKIEKKMEKLDEARDELKEAEADLSR
ncbi:DUF1090 domain-containing protein [Erwinia sp. P6884]|uniref:DUF1090 domain-containing protein n=1 Tax=Erwinia sp. P6884 TaxID=3141450 RepID=UPI0031863D05